jgi:hypothetical protein
MNHQNPSPPRDIKRSRRDRLHALLFAGAALGTTLLTLGAASGPKISPFQGD